MRAPPGLRSPIHYRRFATARHHPLVAIRRQLRPIFPLHQAVEVRHEPEAVQGTDPPSFYHPLAGDKD
ncbi:MAG TPA: hypothetical protein P5159_26170, partial [Phycisphaerae bacterium]|nr:hypothetical protein [Phycisphaerae bacterium]